LILEFATLNASWNLELEGQDFCNVKLCVSCVTVHYASVQMHYV